MAERGNSGKVKEVGYVLQSVMSLVRDAADKNNYDIFRMEGIPIPIVADKEKRRTKSG